jgi:hypothetical protein
MPRRLDAFPPSASSRYPWDEYLDGSVWELTRGEDFQCSVSSFQGAARAQANRRRGTVRMRTRHAGDGREVVIMQFARPATPA